MAALATLKFSVPASAYSTDDAQRCADQLLGAYNEKRYPEGILDIPSITSRAFGNGFQTLSADELEYVLRLTALLLRESFENPTGRYRYRNLVINFTEPANDGNYRVVGSVHITSPNYTGDGSFMALVRPSCQIYQVRIKDVATLDGQVRQLLRGDYRARELME
jgi:hypothetical protein